MLRRIAAPVALLIAATAVSAQDGSTINIEFGSEGRREVWVQKEGDDGRPPSTHSYSGKAGELAVPSETRGVTVYVHDKETGNVSTKSLRTIVRSGTWRVRSSEESHSYQMTFRVVHDGLAVASAMVKISARNFDRDELLVPDDDGYVSFYSVPYGDVRVTVEYKVEDDSKSLPAQVFESKPGSADVPAYELTIDDDVRTNAPAPAADLADDEEEEQPKASRAATIINMVIGVAAIGGMAYMIWRYVKANPDQTADGLKKVGVQVPDDQPIATVLTQKPAGPPKQIILDNAAPDAAQPSTAPPDDSQPSAAPPVAAGPVVKNPRLVSDDGSVYIVKEGIQQAGREEGLDFMITGEDTVSRYHAQISRKGDRVTVMDIGSTNGTYHNGAQIAAEFVLAPGDTIQFGSVQYRYEE